MRRSGAPALRSESGRRLLRAWRFRALPASRAHVKQPSASRPQAGAPRTHPRGALQLERTVPRLSARREPWLTDVGVLRRKDG